MLHITSYALVLVQMLSLVSGETPVPNVLYPFGPEVGDQELFPNDDGSSEAIEIGTEFPFFDEKYSEIYVNNNGLLSFVWPRSHYTPKIFPLDEQFIIIAPFWADVDTSYGQGTVYYRQVTDADLLDQLTEDIVTVYGPRGLSHFEPTWAFIVTWYEVGPFKSGGYGNSGGSDYSGEYNSFGNGGYDNVDNDDYNTGYSSSGDENYGNGFGQHNTFQALILTDGTHSFAMFNYGDIMWTYGSASRGKHAQVGFNAGDGQNYFAIPESRTGDIVDIEHTSNVNTPGRWIFRIDEATISAGGCLDRDSNCAAHQIEVDGSCEDVAPALDDCPRLLSPALVGMLYVYFDCEVPHLYSDSDSVVFEVDFLFDDEKDPQVPTFTIRGDESVVSLHEKYLHGNLGKQVSCQVVSYFEQSPDVKSSVSKSNSYFAGIQASEEYLTVYEGDQTAVSVHLKSTLPIACPTAEAANSFSGCSTKFNISSSNDEAATVVLYHWTGHLVVYQPGRTSENLFSCQYSIDTFDWQFTEHLAYSEDHALFVYSMQTLSNDLPSVESINFLSQNYPEDKYDEEGNPYTDPWDGYSPPAIPVYRYESYWGSGATCYSTGDPNQRTFDGVDYTAHATGQFVLVTSESPRGFQVQARHEACNEFTEAACVCGLAVQEGNDSIILEACNNKPLQKAHRTASSSGILSAGMKLTCNGLGDTYTIQTPSGVFVNIFVDSWGLSVTLHVPSQDYGLTQGLCGTYDGNTENEFRLKASDTVADIRSGNDMNDFVQSWRVAAGESLFEKTPPPVQPAAPVATQYCNCGLQDEIIPCGSAIDSNSYVEIVQSTVTVLTGNIVEDLIVPGRRRKRDTSSDGSVNYDYNPSDFDQALDSVNNLEFSWPTATGITELEATEYCNTGILESAIYMACQNYTDNVEEIVAKCVSDIKVSSTLENWVEDKLNGIYDACKLNVFESISDSSENGTDIASQAIDLLHFILFEICPNECSGNGQCNNSVCTCDEDYEGEDCSVDSTALPNALYLLNNGLCDVSQRECTSVVVVADNLLYTETLSCRVEVKETSAVTTQSGSFEGYGQVRCEVPVDSTNQITYRVSVSRNGADYGEHQEMLVYDGVCLECSGSQCSVQETTCSIDGVCYKNGEADPSDSCNVCDSGEDMHAWSDDCEGDSKTLAIVLGVLIHVILILAIALFVVFIIKKNNSNNKCSSVPEKAPPPYELYGTQSRPTSARSLAWEQKQNGFDCSPVLNKEGSVVALPPVNHSLQQSYFENAKQ